MLMRGWRQDRLPPLSFMNSDSDIRKASSLDIRPKSSKKLLALDAMGVIYAEANSALIPSYSIPRRRNRRDTNMR
jgi:hypothetical protein